LTCTQGTRRDASSVFQPKELRQPFHTRRYISQGWRTRYSHIPSERSEHSERPAGSHGDASLRHRELRPEPAGKRHKAWLHLPATLSRSLATPSEQAQIMVLPGCEPESPRGSPPSGGRAARAPLGTCQAASATLAGQQATRESVRVRRGCSPEPCPEPSKIIRGANDSTESDQAVMLGPLRQNRRRRWTAVGWRRAAAGSHAAGPHPGCHGCTHRPPCCWAAALRPSCAARREADAQSCKRRSAGAATG
jgi:hypothetical protein